LPPSIVGFQRHCKGHSFSIAELTIPQIGLTNLEIIPSKFPENLSKSLSPFEYVLATAQAKAMDVYQAELDSDKGEPALVIAADTIVVSRNGEILEKPRSEADHILMLKMLRDTDVHKVYTAVALMKPMEGAKDPGYELETCCEETTVKFDEAG
jgi:septum formation protein